MEDTRSRLVTRQLTRRDLLLTGAGATGALLLAACGGAAAPAAPSQTPASAGSSIAGSATPAASVSAPAGSAGASTNANVARAGTKFGGVTLPTYAPRLPTKPELPASDPNVDAGFLTYPQNPPKANNGTPGKGGTVTTFVPAYYPLPTALPQNPAWQEVDKQVGATFQISPVALPDLVVKVATLMAGSDYPDLMHFNAGWPSAVGLPQFVEKVAADLTPYFSGDAIKAYPNLAAIPTIAWRQGVYNSKILALPIHRPACTTQLFYNTTVYDAEIGKGTVAKSADDFKRILTTLTRPDQGRYGMGMQVTSNALTWGIQTFAQVFGAPNQWAYAGGKLTHMIETDQYKAALSFARDLWSSKVLHPDVPTYTSVVQFQEPFLAGKFVFGAHSIAYYNDLWRRGGQLKPPTVFNAYTPFSSDGSKPVYHFNPRFIGITAIKQAPKERVMELLDILNWLAAPFGTQEDRLLQYGLEGTDYQLDAKGNPVPTDRGVQDAGYVPWRYFAQRPYVLYDPQIPDYATVLQGWEKAEAPYGIDDPTLGLYSPTSASSGTKLIQAFAESVSEIVRGSQPLSNLDGLVKTWASNGGDKIRSEYLQALSSAA